MNTLYVQSAVVLCFNDHFMPTKEEWLSSVRASFKYVFGRLVVPVQTGTNMAKNLQFACFEKR